MAGNNVSTKAVPIKENKLVNSSATLKGISKSCNQSSNTDKIPQCKNTGLPSKTVEPAPDSNVM